MQIKIKRIYDAPEAADGQRIFVDRLWPRGLSKQSAQLDGWPKALTPSTELRKWYHADPVSRWPEFQQQYEAELDTQTEHLQTLRALAQRGAITLLTAAQLSGHTHADVLKRILEQQA